VSRFKRGKKRQKQHRSKLELVPDRAVVSVCVPSGDYVNAAFALSWVHMTLDTATRENSGIGGLTTQHVGSSILPHSRYTLVKRSFEAAPNVTHLLFIDSDMTFPPDTAMRLVRHNVDMVGINAMSRRPPYETTAWVDMTTRAVTTMESTGLERVVRTGFAVVLIRAEVFKALAPPYFDYEFIPEKDQFRGEDFVFFDRARAAGFELYIDHDLSKQVNHLGSFAFNALLQASVQERIADSESKKSA
jgi:hypothetical protein